MTTIHLQVGPAAPRGARYAAAAFLALWRALTPRVRSTAATARTAVQEAQEVRELALEHLKNDPRFAADLFAAADRHERLHGVS